MDLVNKGFGTRTIAKKLNCSDKTIRYFLIKRGLRKGYKPKPKPRPRPKRDRKKRQNKDSAWRFWSKVDRSNTNGCWPWTSSKDKDGYGVFRYNARKIMAHRIAYLFTYGYLPTNARICHTCDNPGCCNPNHLFFGSDSDNIIDCIVKNKHSNCKLKADQIMPIKNAILNGATVKDVALCYNVSQTTIYYILNGTTWWYIE